MHSDGLVRLLDLTEEAPDNFIAQVPPEMAGGHRLFGGALLAAAIRAAALTVADRQLPESLQYSFLAEGRLDVPVQLVVERSRDGRSMANRRVQLIQDGKLAGVATLSFATPDPGCVAMLSMPAGLPDPESLPPLSTGPLAHHGLSSPFELHELPVAPYTAGIRGAQRQSLGLGALAPADAGRPVAVRTRLRIGPRPRPVGPADRGGRHRRRRAGSRASTTRCGGTAARSTCGRPATGCCSSSARSRRLAHAGWSACRSTPRTGVSSPRRCSRR